MKIWVGIPSARIESVLKVVEAWKGFGIKTCVAWFGTEPAFSIPADMVLPIAMRQSWGYFHNLMAAAIFDWDVYICGNDDTFPIKGIDLIEKCAKTYPGCVIYPNDGLISLCFPIVTRGWCDSKPTPLMDDAYIHNFADNDLYQEVSAMNKHVHCPDIILEHRHVVPASYEAIAKSCHDAWEHDEKRYKSKWGDKPLHPKPNFVFRRDAA